MTGTATATPTDTLRHVIALHLGADTRHVDSTEADAAYRAVITEARGWAADCMWGDVDADDLAAMPEDRVIRGVARHYVGGLAAFVDSGVI